MLVLKTNQKCSKRLVQTSENYKVEYIASRNVGWITRNFELKKDALDFYKKVGAKK